MKKKVIICSTFFLLIDLCTKYLIDKYFNLMETKTIINNFFSLTKVYNYGASWNILTGYRIILIIITIVILGFLFYYQTKFKINNRNIMCFSLLYSGILGNLIDRVFRGYVIDFLDFNILGYDYPVFNFADICIVFGIILMGIAIIKKEDLNEDRS